MKTFRCKCDGSLFFGDVVCMSCSRRVVRCGVCRSTMSVDPVETRPPGSADLVKCLNPECGATLQICQNSASHAVCNGTVPADAPGSGLCRYCDLNSVIPALRVKGNLEKWLLLETAKHRVLAGFENAGFNLDAAAAANAPPLRFQFKQDGREKVTTGHWKGIITIKLAEADSVFRERNRVRFGEAKRTLTDHFRHELGHYVWDWLVKPNRVDEFREIFGDERDPTYANALQSYYSAGAPSDWRKGHVTEYATMHPWEDFAETFRVYLEMRAALDTAEHFGLAPKRTGDLEIDFTQFLRLGIALTEIAREFGFPDLVSASMPTPVKEKLRFIAGLPTLIDRATPAPPAPPMQQTQRMAG